MKKRFLLVFGIVLLAAVGAATYFETHFACYELREVSVRSEKILMEMPDLALTDADMSLGKRLLSSPEVHFASGEISSLSGDVAQRLGEGYLPENASSLDCSVGQNAVYFDYCEGLEKRVILSFFQDEAYGPQKVIGLYRVRGNDAACRTIYENQNGELKKYKETRRWFAYFRDRMWED